MKMLAKTALMAVCLSTAGISVAAESTAAMNQKHADAYVEYRQALFQLIKSNMAPLGGMAKGAIPYDAQVMTKNGMRIEQLAAMLSDYLKVDTSKFDVDTSAKASLWANYSDVNSKIATLEDAASDLQKVAKSGDESMYKQAIGKVGASCKACHDDYKD